MADFHGTVLPTQLLVTNEEQLTRVDKLREIWQHVGFAEEEAAAKLLSLRERLILMLNETVHAEAAFGESIREEVGLMKQEMHALCLRTGISCTHEDDESLMLIQRHRSLKSAIERLQTLSTQRLGQRTAKEAKLASLLQELELDCAASEDNAGLDVRAEPSALDAGGLTVTLLDRLEAQIAKANSIRSARLEQATSLSKQIDALRRHLGIPNSEAQGSKFSNVCSQSALASLEEELGQLTAERERRLRVLNDCADAIAALGAKLRLTENDVTTLPTPEQGLSQQVVDAYRSELERLEALKSSSLARLIDEARGRLGELWEELHLSPDECEASAAAAAHVAGGNGESDGSSGDGADLDASLLAVESEEARLSLRLESVSKIFSLLEKRLSILEQRAQMEASASDPARLLGKGKGAGARLLQEQKLRAAVERDLPRISKKLRELVLAWEVSEGEVLRYDGEAVLELLDAQEEADMRAKEEEKAKKEAEKLEKAEAKRAASARHGGAGVHAHAHAHAYDQHVVAPGRPRSAPVAKEVKRTSNRPATAAATNNNTANAAAKMAAKSVTNNAAGTRAVANVAVIDNHVALSHDTHAPSRLPAARLAAGHKSAHATVPQQPSALPTAMPTAVPTALPTALPSTLPAQQAPVAQTTHANPAAYTDPAAHAAPAAMPTEVQEETAAPPVTPTQQIGQEEADAAAAHTPVPPPPTETPPPPTETPPPPTETPPPLPVHALPSERVLQQLGMATPAAAANSPRHSATKQAPAPLPIGGENESPAWVL